MKNIEDMIIGDYVYTFHEKTLKLDTYKVENVFKVDVDHWYEITTVYGKKIKCSPTHLFMVDGQEKLAKELDKNDYLMYNVNGRLYKQKILSIEIIDEIVTVYNIEVEDAHTYITDNQIWHHNKIAPVTPEI